MTGRALFVSPHTDDSELGAGATMARFLHEGWDVMCVAFSIAEDSVPGDDKLVLSREFEGAMDVLGLGADRRRTLRYPVRRFSEYRQRILDELISLRSQFDPDLIVVPSSADIHQDHAVVHAESVRAFKNRSIWGFVHPWNNLASEDRRFVEVRERHLNAKLEMLSMYRSQTKLERPYFSSEYTIARAKTTGHRIGVKYAESFELIREVDTVPAR